MATLTTETLLGGDGGTLVLPRSVSDEIWTESFAQAVVPTLAKSQPMIIGENVIPVMTKRPAASIVGELENKPDTEIEVGAKVIKPIKAVVGFEFSLETVTANPAHILDLITEEAAQALSRQIDLAVLHGRNASTGAQLSGGLEYLSQTANEVEIGENSDAALWEGYNLVVGGERSHNFTGFAFDPRLTGAIANARDAQGRRINPDIPMGGGLASYSGQPAMTSRTVSGQVDASADTGIRAFGGDWNALRFGRALDISLKPIPYGDPFGHGDLQRRNAVGYLAEVIFGFGILDTNAFVKYTTAGAEAGA